MALVLHHKYRPVQTKAKLQKWIDSLAYIGGVLIPIMTIPQLLKIIQTKSATSLSLVSWVSYLIGTFFWLIYGVSRKEKVIIVTYALSVVIYGLVVIAIIAYR
jgi:uncharacterized protein with PQ loop repeat